MIPERKRPQPRLLNLQPLLNHGLPRRFRENQWHCQNVRTRSNRTARTRRGGGGRDTPPVVPNDKTDDTHPSRGVKDTPREAPDIETIVDDESVQPLRGAETLPVISDGDAERKQTPQRPRQT